MCQRSKFSSVSNDYEKNIEKLCTRKIQPDCNALFKEIWKDRDTYHHLNPTIPTENSKLQDIAKNKIITLHKIESKVFDYDFTNGAVSPRYPKYWDFNENGTLNIYLRIET
ncbi:MAG: hypothetical protein A2Z28_02585 [Chloroflexi bacterium RBG_16_51_9]|nr:MAG: hypothetical protein A2Z28_02585 [Chloroflexi bacterium RBG_16_51_9]